jgi:hypothetical protein
VVTIRHGGAANERRQPRRGFKSGRAGSRDSRRIQAGRNLMDWKATHMIDFR